MNDLDISTRSVPMLLRNPDVLHTCAFDASKALCAVGESRTPSSPVIPLQRARRAQTSPRPRPAAVTLACAEAAGLCDELPDIGALIERLRR
ncbi:hypothetical protein [Streptomyces sp. H27-C3]|uniref:hypothetical protein n=1 Tax=Streptomyces sp. H27-C3 TaxID=3046305 RepID=UPI0024BBA96C|nr:hypothetical protein [Streptomyces sp. H27-C3]MDJ0465018.1 hypothetical protein [Streptomyces sp. H27-C3]